MTEAGLLPSLLLLLASRLTDWRSSRNLLSSLSLGPGTGLVMTGPFSDLALRSLLALSSSLPYSIGDTENKRNFFRPGTVCSLARYFRSNGSFNWKKFPVFLNTRTILSTELSGRKAPDSLTFIGEKFSLK